MTRNPPISVSYTHLDVYKRQGRREVKECGFTPYANRGRKKGNLPGNARRIAAGAGRYLGSSTVHQGMGVRIRSGSVASRVARACWVSAVE